MAKSKNPVNGVYGILADNVIRYIGSGRDIKNSRKSNNFSKMRKGKHNKKLQALWNEIDDESRFSFEVIEECLIRDCFTREKYYKNLHKDTVLNVNGINNTKKDIKTGLRAKRHKELCRETMSGQSNPNCKTDIDVIIQIKCCIRNGMKNGEIAELFGKRKDYIAQIRGNFKWSHVSIPVGYEFNLEQKIETVSTAMEAISEENVLYEVIIPQTQFVETVNV